MSDLISRQDAIDLVRDVCDAILRGCGSHYDGEDVVYDDLLEVDAILKCNKKIRIALKLMKSAQPERKKGRWIEQDDGWDGVYYQCSECREPFILIDGTPADNQYNFCPNCGADLRQEGERDAAD